jgi:chromosome segregation ATPase
VATHSTGQGIIATLLEAIGQTVSSANAAAAEESNAAAAIDKGMEKRQHVLGELAEHYLPAIDRESIAATFQEVRAELDNVLARKTREITKIAEQLADDLPQLEADEETLASISPELDQAVRQRDSTLEQVANHLAKDETFRSLTAALLQCQQRLRQFDERLKEIRQDAEEKLPAFEASDLFQYLWERRYGRGDYRGKLLIRRWDRWIARMIGYAAAAKSYDFLRATPELMSQAIEREDEQADELVATIELARTTAGQAFQLEEIEAKVESLSKQREATLDAVETRQQRIEPLLRQKRELDDSQGEFYRQAIERVTDFLRKTEERVLAERAAPTPEKEDDQIVAELRWESEQIETARTRQEDAEREQRRSRKHEKELTYVVRSLRRSGFDQETCFFDPPVDLERRVTDFFAGRMDEHELLKQLRREQKKQPSLGDRAKAKVESALDNPTAQSTFEAIATVASSVLREVIRPR